MEKEIDIAGLDESKRTWVDMVPSSLRGLLMAVVFVYIVEAIDWLLKGSLDVSLGLRPRSVSGLIGVPMMPFLHGGFGHLISNTFPFLVLGWIVLKAEGKAFVTATIVIILLGGLGTWLIAGKDELHIGASGLVYGYFGYVMTRAVMERNFIWIVIGLVVGLFFGGMFFGVIPGFSGRDISWEGHLCGMLAGVWFGWQRVKEVKALRE